MRISLVIPVYNAEATLPALLDSIARQALDAREAQVIFVNDGSTDRSEALIKAHPSVCLLNEENSGPGAARNLGTSQATGDIIAYADADCRLSDDFLQTHIRLHQENPDVDGFCGSVGPAEPLPLGSAVLADHLCAWFMHHPGLSARSVEYLPSVNMSIKRRVIDVGLRWNEQRITGEDVSFCQQMNERGMERRFAPDALVYHSDRASGTGFLRHQYNWGFHAPFVRGKNPKAHYSWLFPPKAWRARLLSPAVIAGYSSLVVMGWLRHRPLALLSSFPWLLLGKLWYARGVLAGTWALESNMQNVAADTRL